MQTEILPYPNSFSKSQKSDVHPREAGYLTGVEIATELGVAVDTVKAWRLKGWLLATAYDDKPHYLYAPLGADPPKKYRWKSGRYGESTPHVAKGAQYEA